MKKIELQNLENLNGGVSCSYVMGVVFGFGVGSLCVPTPFTIALGAVSAVVGAAGGYLC